jgi:hypothetical protein
MQQWLRYANFRFSSLTSLAQVIDKDPAWIDKNAMARQLPGDCRDGSLIQLAELPSKA